MGGMALGFPDVCLTPTPVGPLPVPYPNIAIQTMAVPAVYNVIYCSAPAHNMNSIVPITNGDNPGINGGLASGTVMGPKRNITAAFTCLIGGMPATRMTSIALQNSTNCLGVDLMPSQLKVLILAP
jgi:hypothetical protein